MPLGFGAELQDSRPLEPGWEKAAPDDAAEARVLWQLLSINALMFVVEMLAGWWANSAALVADAADMLAVMVDGNRLKDISDLPLDLAV